MRAEATSISLASEVQALTQNKNAAGMPLGGDFLMALMSALIQPQVTGSQAAPVDTVVLNQQASSPEGEEVLNVSPWVKIVAENGESSIFPEPAPFFPDGRTEVKPQYLYPGIVVDYQQPLSAVAGMATENPVNYPGPGQSAENLTGYTSVDVLDTKLQTAAISAVVSSGVSAPAAGIEGKMKYVDQEINSLVTQGREVGTDVAMNKDVNTRIPVNVPRDQNGEQGQTAYRQSPAIEGRNIPAQITVAVSEEGSATLRAEPVNAGLSSVAPDFGEMQRPDSQSQQNSQNPGGRGEKEKALIDKDPVINRVTANNPAFSPEETESPTMPQGQAVLWKQAESVMAAVGKPLAAGVLNQVVQESTEGTVNQVENTQGAEAESEPVVFREQAQVNTGAISLSNITPRKFPSEIIPHLMNPVRSPNADGQVTIIRLRLEPENMGEIRIRISYAKGKMAAHFITTSGIVREAIESSLPQLRETLAQYKVDLGEAAAFVGQDQQNSGFGSKGFEHNGRRKEFAGMFSGRESGDKPIITGTGDDRKVNLLI